MGDHDPSPAPADEYIWFHYWPRRRWWMRRPRIGDFLVQPVRWQGWALVAAVGLLWLLPIPLGVLLPGLPPPFMALAIVCGTVVALVLGVMHADEIQRSERQPGDLREP